MANSNEFIRNLADIKTTPLEKGVMTEITVQFYDNGVCNVNGTPISHGDRSASVLSVARITAQILEALEAAWHERQTQRAA